jgi:hypothetical protein
MPPKSKTSGSPTASNTVAQRAVGAPAKHSWCLCFRGAASRMNPYSVFLSLVLAFVVPMAHGQGDSKNAQPKPIETTVCKIMENPSAFNNKLVKVRGFVSVSFEYSMLHAEGCTEVLWFAIADGSGPPGLVATVNGSGKPGGKNAKGAPVKSIPVKLVRDANYERFQHYMTVKAEEKPCLDLLSEPTPPDCDLHQVVATFVGRIDSVSKEIHAAHLKRSSGDRPDFRGFGQMGMFDAQLVLQSVEDALAVDSFGRAKP